MLEKLVFWLIEIVATRYEEGTNLGNGNCTFRRGYQFPSGAILYIE